MMFKIYGKHRVFLLLVLAAHLLFLGWQVVNGNLYLVDSEEYIAEAENILSTGTFYCGELDEPVRYDDFTKRPPVYPLFLSFVFGIGGNAWLVIILQNLLSLFNFILLIEIGTFIGLQEKHFRWMIPLILLYPAQFIYANMVMSEILFQTFLLGMTLAAMKGISAKSWRWIGIYTLLLIAGAMTKPVLYLFIIPHSVVIAALIVRWRSPMGVWHLVIPFLIWGAYMKANERQTGYFHFSSIQNLSLLQYTTYNLLIHTYGPDSALVLADGILYRSLDQPSYAEGQKLLVKECSDVIRAHKLQFVKFHIKGMINLFMDPGRFDLYSFTGIDSQHNSPGFLSAFSEGGYRGIGLYLQKQPLLIVLLLVLVALANAVKLAGLIYFAFCRRVSVENRVIIIGLVLYIAGLTGSSGASRFAVPVFPLLLLMIPCFIIALVSLRSASNKKKVY
ncbi:MAG: hypothetical protein R3D00_16260 [Bacteroidia bacterium]